MTRTIRSIMILAAILGIGVALIAQNPETAVFPGAVATDSDLLVAANNAVTRLTYAITASATSFDVVDASAFRTPSVVRIDNEYIKICEIDSNTMTVCTGGRGYIGTAAAHAAQAVVEDTVTEKHHNKLAAEIKAVEGALGQNMQNVVVQMTRLIIEEDFLGSSPGYYTDKSFTYGWKSYKTKDSAGFDTEYGAPIDQDHPGVTILKSGTENDGSIQLYLADYYGAMASMKAYRNNVWEAHWIFKVGTLTDGHAYLGFSSSYGENRPGAAGSLSLVIDSATANMTYWACDDSNCISQDSGVAKDTNWHRVKFYRLPGDTANTVRFCLDACTASWQATSRVFAGDGWRAAPSAISANSSSGTTSNSLYLDAFYMLMTGLTRF